MCGWGGACCAIGGSDETGTRFTFARPAVGAGGTFTCAKPAEIIAEIRAQIMAV